MTTSSTVPSEDPDARRIADAVSESELERLRALAVDVALEAGALARDRRLHGVEVADTKSSPVDVVTEVDREVEAVVRARLAAARPDDGFFGEESSPTESAGDFTWIVDPIDGTVNYLYGIPAYAVSIALVAGDPASDAYATLVGVVVNPALGECFTAVRGGGAELGGAPLACSTQTDLSLALVGTGFGYEADRRGRQAVAWAALAPRVRDLRRMGAAALDLCNVAAGRYDLYYEAGTNAWDHAAGALIAREAGARVTGGEGLRESRRLVIAGPEVLVEAFERIAPAEVALELG
ncbi:inositol monophosphatase [Pseudoclavibacter chungangensis]|uniref:Inositol-1-monophosphatase n=1 Tax=Pseudoclavibacter chungangensis TaxID=587635 RepID=A0A7J5BT79_9MICO|nr:inositol monophosphatase family protein [Pseudoclavibacter chungangensis]KAB1656676.1 inositol monophosphatase [Pseudoclavibacter chungangensis]NYJ67872.1 myo-inositol-1(or 4)-monophosphatase [Pseudoclavibacter chungangensis]